MINRVLDPKRSFVRRLISWINGHHRGFGLHVDTGQRDQVERPTVITQHNLDVLDVIPGSKIIVLIVDVSVERFDWITIERHQLLHDRFALRIEIHFAFFIGWHKLAGDCTLQQSVGVVE